MQTYFNCSNNSLQFGMAFRKGNIPKLMEYTRMDKSLLVQRGFRQFNNRQAKIMYYDVVFDSKTKSASVIDNFSNKTVSIFPANQRRTIGLDYGKSFPGRKLLAIIFNPQAFLPSNILLAGIKAHKLEKQKLLGKI